MWLSHFKNEHQTILNLPPEMCKQGKAADKVVPKWIDIWHPDQQKYLIPYSFETGSYALKSKGKQAVEQACAVFEQYTNVKFMREHELDSLTSLGLSLS